MLWAAVDDIAPTAKVIIMGYIQMSGDWRIKENFTHQDELPVGHKAGTNNIGCVQVLGNVTFKVSKISI